MLTLPVATVSTFLLSFLGRVVAESTLHQPIPLLGNFLVLELVENRGIAFGLTFPALLQGMLICGALLFVLVLACRSRQERVASLAFGMILGGAIGNIVDRFDDGLVTDFIRVGSFPTFNVADSFITVGVGALLLWECFKKPGKNASR